MKINSKHSALIMMLMSIIISAIILFASSLFEVNAHGNYTFCDGWKDGYKNGYCFKDYTCIAPIAPVCPVPYPGMDTYKDGYNRGFLFGVSERLTK